MSRTEDTQLIEIATRAYHSASPFKDGTGMRHAIAIIKPLIEAAALKVAEKLFIESASAMTIKQNFEMDPEIRRRLGQQAASDALAASRIRTLINRIETTAAAIKTTG